MPKRSGRKSAAQTPAPKKERIYGSKKNPKGSASSEKTASSIQLSANVLSALTDKLTEFRKSHPKNKKVTLADLKAVYRRGAGAYSSTHRPTITGGKPNTRNAWAMARVNKFLLKAGGTKVKKAYVQDDDLLKYEVGGNVKTDFNEFENDGLRKALLSFWGDFINGNISEYLSVGKEDYVLTDYDDMMVITRNGKDFSEVEKSRIKNWIEPYLNEDKKPYISKYLIGYEIENNRIMIKINPNESYAKGGLIAPNGEPSNLTPEQYKLVRTPEFKAWFGDWENDPANASKVVDENGEPLVCYHGSRSQVKFAFSEFNVPQEGVYFTNDYKTATWFSDGFNYKLQFEEIELPSNINEKSSIKDLEKYYKQNIDSTAYVSKYDFDDGTIMYRLEAYNETSSTPLGKNLQDAKKRLYKEINYRLDDINYNTKRPFYRVFLNIRNPYKIDAKGKPFYETPFEDGDYSAVSVTSTIKSRGKNDGVIIKNTIETTELSRKSNSYIVFNPTQIKLADGTNTTFDGSNPDIRYEGGGEIDKLIQDGIVEIKMYDTKPEHAKMYGFDSERPLYIQSIIVSEEHRGKGIGSKVMQHIVDYATTNGHDVIFGHITQEAEPNIDVIKSMLRKSEFKTIEGNNDFYKIMNEYAYGGETEDHAETYKKWRSLVNMSLSELKRFYDSEEGKKAGLSASEAKSQGIDSGRESARWIMKMKQTPKSEWTPAMWKWAKKQISFISRMSGNKGGLYDDKGNKTRKHTSLLIWGHNPKKSSSMKYEVGGEMDVRMEDTVQRMDDPNFADPSYYENGGMSDIPADFSKVISSSSRFRPSETIYFDPPLIGMNGNQLVSYTWSYEWTEDWSKTKGEPVAKRISDWTQAELSADTGRNIVHKYTILKKDGTSVTVSSDSVPVLLGYVDRTQTVQFSNLATASKTLAKQKLQLSLLEAKNKEYQDAKNEIISRGYPEVVNMGEGVLGIKYMMGDAGVWDGSAKVEDPIDKERLGVLKDSYVHSELKKMGIDPYSGNVTYKISELKNRIARQERKIQNILDSKMEDGGVLYGLTETEVNQKVAAISKKYKLPKEVIINQLKEGIKAEMEHTDDKSIASKIALDHLDESPVYYQKLKVMEQEIKQMPDQEYLNSIVSTYAKGGTVDMIYNFRTPTGEPTKLNYIQQVLVRTNEFKNWFGDWESCAKTYMSGKDFKESYEGCSIVVDQFTLEPQVVFHGTNFKEEFYTFDVTREQGSGRPYGYFADNREYSENFTSSSQRGEHGLSILYSCFLNIRKPFFAIDTYFYDKKDDYMYWILAISKRIFVDKYGEVNEDNAEKFTDTVAVVTSQIGYYLKELIPSGEKKPFWLAMSKDKDKEFKAFLISHGYDGVRYAEEFMSVYDVDNPAQFTKAWTIFDANQVKLADGRNLDFDPMKKDIRYEEGGETYEEVESVEEPTKMKYVEIRKKLGLEKTYAEGGHVEGDGEKTNDAKRGGFFKGRSHAEGGIKGVNVDTGQLLEVEGNEVIINKKSVQDPKKRMFEGKMMTNREILSKINEEGGGVAFEDGGEITEKSCRCTGKKYKFGGNLVSDFDIVKELTSATDMALTPIDSAVKYVDGLISRMYGK